MGLGVLPLAVLVVALTAQPAARPPEEIVAELEGGIEEAPMPEHVRGQMKPGFREGLEDLNKRKFALVLELYEAAPDHDKLVKLLPQRWQFTGARDPWTVLRETASALEQPLLRQELRIEAAFYHAAAMGTTNRPDPGKAIPAIERFMEMAPGDNRAARLLLGAARMSEDPDFKLELYRRALRLFPDAPVNRYTPGKIRQIEAIGEPFELDFTCAATGGDVSVQKTLRGKVVVIVFWATERVPAVVDVARMRRLYDRYRDRGVEFIGVSLDDPKEKGGLNKLRWFVGINGVAWPQYYQGAGAYSEFSTGWGVDELPTVFVVNPEGRLHTVNGRRKLEEIIAELLARRDRA